MVDFKEVKISVGIEQNVECQCTFCEYWFKPSTELISISIKIMDVKISAQCPICHSTTVISFFKSYSI